MIVRETLELPVSVHCSDGVQCRKAGPFRECGQGNRRSVNAMPETHGQRCKYCYRHAIEHAHSSTPPTATEAAAKSDRLTRHKCRNTCKPISPFTNALRTFGNGQAVMTSFQH